MENFIGKMGKYIKDNGRMGSSMEKGKFMMQMEINKQENGLMVKKLEVNILLFYHFFFFFFYSFFIIFYIFF
jgi:hypothetical protein